MGPGSGRCTMEQMFGQDTDVFICIIQGSHELLICFEVPFVPPLEVTCEQENGISKWFPFVLIAFGSFNYQWPHMLRLAK